MEFIFLAIVLIFSIVSESVVRKKFGIERKRGLYKPVNKIHKWLEILFFSSFFILYIISNEYFNLEYYYFFIALSLIFLFRAFMEWKFEKESKQYIISILTVCIYLLIFIGLSLL